MWNPDTCAYLNAPDHKGQITFLVVNFVKMHLLRVIKADPLILTLHFYHKGIIAVTQNVQVEETQPLSLLSILMIRRRQTRSRENLYLCIKPASKTFTGPHKKHLKSINSPRSRVI